VSSLAGWLAVASPSSIIAAVDGRETPVRAVAPVWVLGAVVGLAALWALAVLWASPAVAQTIHAAARQTIAAARAFLIDTASSIFSANLMASSPSIAPTRHSASG
jgi:hypothetical protein